MAIIRLAGYTIAAIAIILATTLYLLTATILLTIWTILALLAAIPRKRR